MPKISVVIPFYNLDKWLITRSVSSVLNQTFQDFEIIIVDDGSSKIYSEILTEIIRDDKRIRFLRQEHKGVSAARNLGVREALGEYIVFLDADDIILPEFFREAYGLCKNYKIDFLIGGNTKFSDKWSKNGNRNTSFEIEEIGDENKYTLIKNLIGDLRKFGNKGGYIGRGSVARLIRCEIARDVLFDEELYVGEDILWNLQILEKSKCVYIAYRIWYLYYYNPNSLTHKYNPQILANVELGLSKLENHLDLKEPDEFIGYCSRLLDQLKIVYVCFLGHEDCDLSMPEKREISLFLYSKEPWVKIKKIFLKKGVGIKTLLKSIAYCTHTFSLFVNIRKKLDF